MPAEFPPGYSIMHLRGQLCLHSLPSTYGELTAVSNGSGLLVMLVAGFRCHLTSGGPFAACLLRRPLYKSSGVAPRSVATLLRSEAHRLTPAEH